MNWDGQTTACSLSDAEWKRLKATRLGRERRLDLECFFARTNNTERKKKETRNEAQD
jgi:hypothetical protein